MGLRREVLYRPALPSVRDESFSGYQSANLLAYFLLYVVYYKTVSTDFGSSSCYKINHEC